MSATVQNTTQKNTAGFSDEERAAMQERARELREEASARKASGKTGKLREAGETALRAKIAEMPEPDRSMAQRIHEIVTANAPALMPKTWYGMPAYANAEGKVVCFFQGATKFQARYATFGFNDSARLDDGNLWPTSFAVQKLTTEGEEQIKALVQKAVGK